MFCPKCSLEANAPDRQFCSRCGFQIGALSEFLAHATHARPAIREDTSIKEKDINIGASLVYLGTILATFVTASLPGPNASTLIAGALTLMIAFLLVVFASQFFPRRRGISVGASVMVLAVLFAGLLVSIANYSGFTALSLASAFFAVVLLLSRFIKRTIERLEHRSDEEQLLEQEKPRAFLFGQTTALNDPTSFNQTKSTDTAEMVQPPSITDRTTNLLVY